MPNQTQVDVDNIPISSGTFGRYSPNAQVRADARTTGVGPKNIREEVRGSASIEDLIDWFDIDVSGLREGLKDEDGVKAEEHRQWLNTYNAATLEDVLQFKGSVTDKYHLNLNTSDILNTEDGRRSLLNLEHMAMSDLDLDNIPFLLNLGQSITNDTLYPITYSTSKDDPTTRRDIFPIEGDEDANLPYKRNADGSYSVEPIGETEDEREARLLKREENGQRGDSPEFDRLLQVEAQRWKDEYDITLDWKDLKAFIAFESADSFDTAAPNRKRWDKKTGRWVFGEARGLIQFMGDTAGGLGVTLGEIERMTQEEQLSYVTEHMAPALKRLLPKGQQPSMSDFYMSIIWPKAIGWDDDAVVWSSDGKTGLDPAYAKWAKDKERRDGKKNNPIKAAYASNEGLDLDKDGILTKGEIAAQVIQKRQDLEGSPQAETPEDPSIDDQIRAEFELQNNTDYNESEGEFASGESRAFFEGRNNQNLLDPSTLTDEQLDAFSAAFNEAGTEQENFDALPATTQGRLLSPEAERQAGQWIEEALTDPNLPPAIMARIKGLLPDTYEAVKVAAKWLGLSMSGLYPQGGALTEKDFEAIDTNPYGSYQRLIEAGIDPNSQAAWLSMALDPTNYIDPVKGLFSTIGFLGMAIRPITQTLARTRVLTDLTKTRRFMPKQHGHGIVLESRGGTRPFADVTDLSFNLDEAAQLGKPEDVILQGLILYGGDIEAVKKLSLASRPSVLDATWSGMGHRQVELLKEVDKLLETQPNVYLEKYRNHMKTSGYGTEVTLPKNIDKRVLVGDQTLLKRMQNGELTKKEVHELRDTLLAVLEDAGTSSKRAERAAQEFTESVWINMDGDGIYEALVEITGAPEAASKLLVKHGIIGKRAKSSYAKNLYDDDIKDDQYIIYDPNELSINAKQTDVTKHRSGTKQPPTKGKPEYGTPELNTKALLAFMNDYEKVFNPTGLSGPADYGGRFSPNMGAYIRLNRPSLAAGNAGVGGPGDRIVYLSLLRNVGGNIGDGGRAMRQLKTLADKHGIAMIGNAGAFEAVANTGLAQDRLEKFYGTLGGKLDPRTGDFIYFPKDFPPQEQRRVLALRSGLTDDAKLISVEEAQAATEQARAAQLERRSNVRTIIHDTDVTGGSRFTIDGDETGNIVWRAAGGRIRRRRTGPDGTWDDEVYDYLPESFSDEFASLDGFADLNAPITEELFFDKIAATDLFDTTDEIYLMQWEGEKPLGQILDDMGEEARKVLLGPTESPLPQMEFTLDAGEMASSRPLDNELRTYVAALDEGRTLRDIDPTGTSTHAEILNNMTNGEINRAMHDTFRRGGPDDMVPDL